MPRRLKPVEALWSVAVLLTLLGQIFLTTLRTRAGQHLVPLALVEARMIQPSQIPDLLSVVHPGGDKAVRILARQVELTVPPSHRLVLVWAAKPDILRAAELSYRLYPRTFVERTATSTPGPPEDCAIFWNPPVDIALSCSGASWRYAPAEEAHP